jgi:hypothetical protein
MGIDSIHIDARVTPNEFRALGEYLGHQETGRDRSGSVSEQLASAGVAHISLGRILPVDSYAPGQEWPEAPEEIFDSDYRESVDKARDAFEYFSRGFAPGASVIQELLDVIVGRAANSGVAMSQVLALKSYENLTYLHSVNVTLLSVRLGERIGLDEPARMALAEAALLHDVGKTRIPIEILTKSGLGLPGSRRPENAASAQPDRIRRRYLRVAHRSKVVSRACNSGQSLPHAGPTCWRGAKPGTRESIRKCSHVLSDWNGGPYDARRTWCGRTHVRGRCTASHSLPGE